MKTPGRRVCRWLAEVLVAGPWRVEDMADRASRAVGRRRPWLKPLIRRLLAEFGDGPRPTRDLVAALLATDPGLGRANARRPVTLSPWAVPEPVMWPAPGPPETWPVPALTTPGDLARFLGLSVGELEWFADVQGRGCRGGRDALRHYEYAWRPKPTGSVRLIEAPRPRLKALQRRVLDGVLAPIPPHDAAHGFRPGRSIRTFAGPHAGQDVVLRLDLRDFFPSVTAARVVAVFLTAGYPEAVARLLAGVCTHRVPGSAWRCPGAPALGSGPDAWRSRRRYAQPHLPQGAPTSPALANLAAFRLDARLAGLAASAGARYTRYADDLVFSGGRDLARSIERFSVTAAATALEEGFQVNPRKTRAMRRGARQQVAGVVVNARPNVARDDYDRLKATLHNSARFGLESQNRNAHPDFRAHLAGLVAHVAMLNPARGAKLRAMLEAITG
jgi:retron-type reverse transcriptase